MERWFTSPVADGYRMPAEYEPHHGTIMIWPVRPGSWPHGGRAAQRVFTEIARKIAEGEQLYMLANPSDVAQVRAVFAQDKSIHVLEVPTDDAWARDTMPTFVKNGRTIRGIDWQFNAWGGAYDGLYAHWEQDDRAATAVCEQLGLDLYDQHDFVLEGGSIHSDGEGTVIVTESCLLSPGRNPQLTKTEIEERLKTELGAEKIIWLPRGIYNDETNEHVDNVCAFTGPAEVVLAWTEDTEDPQYALSQASLRTLESETDAKGRPFTVHKLLIPKKPVCVTEQDLEGYSFEEGEDVRECGERLAASYVNFYIANQAVLCPQFGDAHDALAVAKLAELFPGREIYPVQARDILVGGGNIHCITQQIPDFER